MTPFSSRQERLILLLVFLAICGMFVYAHFKEWPTSKFYVYADETRAHVLYINGRSAGAHEQHVPGWDVYCKYTKVYGDRPTNRVEIKRLNSERDLEVVYEDSLPAGSYVANLSPTRLVSFAEVNYGRPLNYRGTSLAPSSVGVYLIDESTDILVFGFHAKPPDSMSGRHGSAERRRYVDLRVHTASATD